MESLVSGLAAAHAAYGGPKSNLATQTGILFIVQPNNINICDERPLEYALWDQTPPIPAFRLEFGEEVLAHTFLTSSRELLYRSPSYPSLPLEFSVVYMRAGYDMEEYDTAGCTARLQLERSRAIKCPSVLCHLSTFKKVQQGLAMPGTLTRFLSRDSAARIEKTFVPLYPLDESDLGQSARALACNVTTAAKHVLKPSLEGGGHNIYRDDIPEFLEDIPESLWHTYILMELINPPVQDNILLSQRGLYSGPVISELGIFGVCLWRSTAHGPDLIENFSAGWSFKTKTKETNEMSVIKGYGCFDSPCLI